VKLNMSTHLRTSFGDIIAEKTPSQSKTAITDAPGAFGIAIGRDLSSKGDIKVLVLLTGEVVSRHTFEPCRLTPDILKKIQAHSAEASAPTQQSTSPLPDLRFTKNNSRRSP
jgi:hypothetical protein